jgi:hypothetical protein
MIVTEKLREVVKKNEKNTQCAFVEQPHCIREANIT